MQQPKTTRKRLPKRGAHARALAAAAALENRDVDLDDDEMSHTVLQRGSACLSCRKRKLKCDAVRPACRKCVTAGRADECNYDDGKQKTRTQLLQEKVKELEEKLLTLEAGSIGSDDDGVGSDQPPALAPAIIALPDGTIQSNGHAPNQMMNGYPQSLFDEPSQNTPAHFDALLNRDTGTLQVFGQQDHSANNLLDVTSGPVPSWLGDFTGSFEGSPTTDTTGTGFSGISLARAVGSPGDSNIDRQLTAYLNGSAMTSGTNVGFSSMALPPGQTTVPSQFIDITASYGVVPDPALSFTLDAFPDIDGVPARWLDQDQLPTNIRNYLIDLFMPHRHRCGFEVHIGRFLASLDLPINKRPHPCLMNAIYLLGCHYAPGGALSHLEPMFLSKARASLAESLEHADRLKDFLFASALLACYFYFKGRLLEGQHHNSAAVRFAMSCGLHQISSPVWRGSEYATTATGSAPWQVTSMSLRRAGSMLDPPRDPIELYELINIFWLTFITDRAGSLGTGLPHAIKDSEITTVFPRPLKEFEDGTISDETNATIMNMYEQGNHAQDASKDSLHALRVKSLALLERSSRLSMVPESERTSTFWHEFRATDMALDRISKTLPHIHSGMGINDTSSLIFVHTFVQGSTIQLHSQFVDADQTSYDRSVRAADAAMQVVRMIDNIDAKNFHMLMGLSWICVADVLKREIQRKRSISDEDGARHTEQELEALFAVMKRLRQVYPVLELTVFDQWGREALRLNTRETRGSKEDAASLKLNCTMLNSTPSTPSGPSTPSAVSRPPTASIVNQRRARRAQPYTPTSVVLTPEHESGPQIGLFDSPGSTLGSSVVHQSSRTSTDSPSSSSSPSEGTSGGVSHPSSVLQRGSACLTCRRRKLKCDANKPACTACTRAGRSQTCSYDDGLPKSRVQILTSKVRDLEAKISAMETARQTAFADTSYQAHPLFMPADTLSCTPGASGSGASAALLSRPYLTQDSQAWAPYVPEQNELLNLAASLAIPNSEPLAHTRNELLGTLRKLTPWWELDEIPSGMQRYLIDVFLARKWEPGVGIDAPRLWASLSLPMADQHHKCFLNAMYLIACSFAGDKSFEDMQPTFVAKVRKEMEAALVQGDRLIDFIRASNLLSFYYFLKGRFLEGHHLSSTAARFAIACGLHQLGSPQWQPQSEYGRIDNIDDRGLVATSPNAMPRAMCTNNMVPRPRDNIEKNEYIHAYWTVHMHDMGIGLLTGLATSVADSEVNTPWPTPVDSAPLPSGQFGQPTVVSLYSGIPGTADMSRDSHSQSLRVKSMCLLTRAAKLSAAFDSARYLEPGLLAKHEACDRALIEALQTMPMESTHTDLEWTTMIAAARTTLLTGQVQLHGFLAGKRRESREKCLIAANEALDVLRRLRLIAVPEALLLLLVVDWIILKEWYIVEKSRLLAEGNMLAAESVEQSIQELVTEIGSVPAIPTVSGLKH